PCREWPLGDELARDLGHCVDVPSEVHVVGGHRDDVVPARAGSIENLPDLLIRSTHLGAGSVLGRRGTRASRDDRPPSVRLDRSSLDHGSVYTWPGGGRTRASRLAASGRRLAPTHVRFESPASLSSASAAISSPSGRA